MSEPRKFKEFWINERSGDASSTEDSIPNGYHLHVIELSTYQALEEKLRVAVKALEFISNHVEWVDEKNQKVTLTYATINIAHEALRKIEGEK